uniref:tRNA wybutosine-synthesis domain-containing protein n=1 Tax=Strigops habroptila TaxID=2489341 RepID=A0A672UU44_STRHB
FNVSVDTWSFFYPWLVPLWLHRFYVYSAVAFEVSIWIIIQFSTSKPQKKVTKHVSTLSEKRELFETSSEEEADAQEAGGTNSVIDVEDLSNIMSHMKKAKRECELEEGDVGMKMITPPLREALTKQACLVDSGLALVSSLLQEGSSWFCSVFLVPGFIRYRCMVWEGMLVDLDMFFPLFAGVSGVQATCFEEAMTAKHCALPLVGESPSIPTCLVTNPVMQLYVSMDASTKESLKRIDPPLFKDFWQRFLHSLKALSEKQQHIVYRLTLVKAWSVDELKAYADLMSLGKPDFIKVKGVTYCGKSLASSLTMANVPWHEEVVHFVQELTNLIPDYEITCEHEHSNHLLIAHKKVRLCQGVMPGTEVLFQTWVPS